MLEIKNLRYVVKARTNRKVGRTVTTNSTVRKVRVRKNLIVFQLSIVEIENIKLISFIL